MSVPQMSPVTLSRALDAGEALVVLDVREAWEVEIAALEGSVNIPLGQIPARAGLDLDPDAKIVVLCHHGIRSQHVAAFLKSQRDFDDVHNLTGGIDAWSRVVDPALRRY